MVFVSDGIQDTGKRTFQGTRPDPGQKGLKLYVVKFQTGTDGEIRTKEFLGLYGPQSNIPAGNMYHGGRCHGYPVRTGIQRDAQRLFRQQGNGYGFNR